MKRRLAVHKINTLPEASPEQLANFDDVCAICYQELSTARITRCNHYFHGGCLRKWLFVQDICPLCHETLYVMTDEPQPQVNMAVIEPELDIIDQLGFGFDEPPGPQEWPAPLNNRHEHVD